MEVFNGIGPGVHKGLSFDEYLALPYLSNSTIKIGHSISMGHMKAAVDGKWEDAETVAKTFGSAFHCWVLEPDRFQKEWKIAGQCCAVKKPKRKGEQGERCSNTGNRTNENGDWYCGVHGKGLDLATNVITESTLEDIKGIGQELRKNDAASILRTTGVSELTIVAEYRGVLIKTRIDWLALTSPTKSIVDLKKIQRGKGNDYDLRKSIRDYGYDSQSALYRRVYDWHFKTGRPSFQWLFAEDKYPHGIVPRYASEKMDELGWAKVDGVIDRWIDCEKNDYWPGYDSDLRGIDPDSWELEKYGVAR